MAVPKTIHTFGPGEFTVVAEGGSSYPFICQVKGIEITSDYEEIAEEVIYLGGREAGCYEPAEETRTDSISIEIDHDLTATGLYQWCQYYDLQQADFTYVPNTGMGTQTPAQWDGRVVVKSPNVNADEYGARLDGTVDWQGVGAFTFTAAVDTAVGS
jgi:hypothetical protein